jgi:pimeloyl-ACP methyl ester carboxylesterase
MPQVTTRDGTAIHYEMSGIGDPPLIWVHGWCSKLEHWEAQTRHFGAHHRVLAIDRRGHGQSDTPEGGYSAVQHTADLAEVSEAEGIRAAVVVGHAGGGPTVLELARSAPDLVAAVVLVDTIVSGATRIADPDDPGGRRLAGFIDGISGPDGDEYFRDMYRGFFSSDAGAIADEAVSSAATVPRRIAVAELEALAIDTRAIAAEISQPVLWLSAEPANTRSLEEVFEDVRFGVVVGSGHFPQLEVPDQVNAMIDRFVSTL